MDIFSSGHQRKIEYLSRGDSMILFYSMGKAAIKGEIWFNRPKEKIHLVTRTIDFIGKYVIRKKQYIVWDTCS